MKRACLGSLVVLSLMLGALAVVAADASATLVKAADGHYVSIALPGGVAPASVPGSVAATRHIAHLSYDPNVNYHGGAVVHSSAPYLIFWAPSGYTISASTQSLLERYFTDVAADSGMSNNVYSVSQQYYDQSGYANYAQTFSAGQAIVDTQAYPALDTANCVVPSGVSYCITDAQLETEVERLIGAHHLPTDGSTSNAELNADAPIYFVVLPQNVNQCLSSSTCATNVFCAYHSSLTDGTNNVLYAAIPLLPAVGKDCQHDGNSQVQSPNGDQQADIAIKYMTHEDNETITDPVIACTVDGTPDQGCGWWDNDTGQEIADNCNMAGSFDPENGTNPNAFTPTLGGSAGSGNLYNQLDDGQPYYVQSMWSNADGNCELRASTASTPTPTPTPSPTAGSPSTPTATTPPSGPTATATSAPSAVFSATPSRPGTGQPVSFNATGSSSPGRSIVAYAWKFGDGTTGSGATPKHTYRKTGTYTVTLAVGDSAGQMGFVSHTVTVSRAGATKVSAGKTTSSGATLLVTVNAPGKVQLGGKSLRVKSAGTLRFRLKLSATRERTLSTSHRLALLVTIKFTPAVGKRFTKSATIVFRS